MPPNEDRSTLERKLTGIYAEDILPIIDELGGSSLEREGIVKSLLSLYTKTAHSKSGSAQKRLNTFLALRDILRTGKLTTLRQASQAVALGVRAMDSSLDPNRAFQELRDVLGMSKINSPELVDRVIELGAGAVGSRQSPYYTFQAITAVLQIEQMKTARDIGGAFDALKSLQDDAIRANQDIMHVFRPLTLALPTGQLKTASHISGVGNTVLTLLAKTSEAGQKPEATSEALGTAMHSGNFKINESLDRLAGLVKIGLKNKFPSGNVIRALVPPKQKNFLRLAGAYERLLNTNLLPTPLLVRKYRASLRKSAFLGKCSQTLDFLQNGGEPDVLNPLQVEVNFSRVGRQGLFYEVYSKGMRELRDDPYWLRKEPLHEPFQLTTTRTVTHIPKQLLGLIQNEKAKLIQAVQESSKPDSLKERARTLQAKIDSTPPWEREKLYEEQFKTQLALALADEELQRKIKSEDPVESFEGIAELYQDRLKEVSQQTTHSPERAFDVLGQRASNLRRLGLRVEFQGFDDCLQYFEQMADLPEARRQAQARVTDIKRQLSEAIQVGQQGEADNLSAALALARNSQQQLQSATPDQSEFAARIREELLSPNPIAQNQLRMIQKAYRQVKPVSEGQPVVLEFDSTPSSLDAFAGYVSGDCTKGRFKMFAGDGIWNTKVWQRIGAEKRHVGNVYVAQSKDGRTLHLDAIQIPLQIDHEKIARELPAKYLEKTSARGVRRVTLGVSLLSNHASVRKAWDKVHSGNQFTQVDLPDGARPLQTYGRSQKLIAE